MHRDGDVFMSAWLRKQPMFVLYLFTNKEPRTV